MDKRLALTRAVFEALDLAQNALWGDQPYKLADSYRQLAEATYLWSESQVEELHQQATQSGMIQG